MDTWTIYHADADLADWDRPPPPNWPAPGTIPWHEGQVLRARLREDDRPFPRDAPGFRQWDDGLISAVVVTVGEGSVSHFRQTGNGGLPPEHDTYTELPSDLIDDGRIYAISVRPATAEEAAPLLAHEAVRGIGDRELRTHYNLIP